MSISNEISRIKAAKESLKSAINARGGTLTTELLDDYAAAVTALPSGGSDIDLSGVTVTADKLLAGVVAVDGSGSKVTGTIPEVTASRSGNTVTVPAGHHAKRQEFIFEEAPINLSFVTATASDILTGKVGADKNGNPVTGTLVIPSVPEAPDLSVVTVTADTMLKGKVAVNSAGQKITGTIETVTATLNANTVSVPKGYIASAQTLTVPEAKSPTVSGNVVTVYQGYQKSQTTATVAKATATLSANVVTIPEGYHDANTLTVAESQAPIVADNKVTVYQGYNKEQKTITVAEANAPSVSGNVVTFGKGYNATEKQVTVGTARESTTITPGTSWKQIPADTYCVGAQYIAGDENLVPENIAEGVSIFGIEGTHSGGGGGGEFYKCAAVYGPYDVETVVISGCPVADANGEYLPTDQTTSDGEGRAYPVYANGKGWYYGYSEFGGYGITQDFNNGLVYSGEVGNGTWYDNMEWMPVEGMTGVKGTATLDADVPKTWDGYKAVLSGGVYTFENAVTEGLTYSDNKPQKYGIYSDGATMKIDWIIQDYPTIDLAFFAPFTEELTLTESGQKLTCKSAELATVGGVQCVKFDKSKYSYIECLQSGAGVGVPSYTVFFNFYLTSINDSEYLFCLGSGEYNKLGIRCYSNGGNYYAQTRIDFNRWGDEGVVDFQIELNTWITVAIIVDGGIKKTTIYRGKNKAAELNRYRSTDSGDLTIGKFGGDYGSSFINNFMVYNRVLSETEIGQLVDKFSPTA